MTRSKSLSFGIGSVFALVFFLSLVSATISVSNIPTLSQTGNSFSLDLLSNQNETVVISGATIYDSNNNAIIFDSKTVSLINGTPQNIEISYLVSPDFNFELGQVYSSLLSFEGEISNTTNQVISFQPGDFCGLTETIGNLRLEIEDVKVVEGFGDEENFWYLYDLIEVEVVVENNGNWDMENIKVEWALYNTAGKKINDGTIKEIDLEYNEDETLVFQFRLDRRIRDFEGEDAVLYIKAKGEIDDSDSPYDGNRTCFSRSLDVDVETGDKFVIIGGLKINSVSVENRELSSTVNCGADLVIDAEIINIGSKDQKDLYVRMYNSVLGINERVNFDKIKKFQDDNAIFNIQLPRDIKEGWYELKFEIYDEDNDIFENSEDDLAIFSYFFEVRGNCEVSKPLVSASLNSEFNPGEELVIRTIITNTDSKNLVFNLNLMGYTNWASSARISEEVISLGPGEAKEVFLSFNVNKDAEGIYDFNLEIISENQLVLSQKMVTPEFQKSGFNFLDFIKENWLISLLVVLIAILIIAIIIVAIKLSRR